MTREEASSVLDDYDVNFDGHTAEEIAEAFDVAFRALEQEPCEDCVSRKAVDRLAWEYLRKPTDENVAFYEHFLELPSVTPQEPILDKIRTEIMQLDCDTDYIDYDYNDMAQTEEVHMICREEVLQIIDKYILESEDKDGNDD